MIARKPGHRPRFLSARTWRQACLLSGMILLGSSSGTWMAQAGEVHLFRSLKADRTRIYQGPPGSGGGHPLVCRLKNGEILAAFQAWEADSDWRVLWARSKDGGLHWSEPQVLVDSDDSEGNLALGVLKDGAVLLGYETFRLFRGKDPPQARFLSYDVIRSTDHGESWSSPAKIPRTDNLALASYSSCRCPMASSS